MSVTVTDTTVRNQTETINSLWSLRKWFRPYSISRNWLVKFVCKTNKLQLTSWLQSISYTLRRIMISGYVLAPFGLILNCVEKYLVYNLMIPNIVNPKQPDKK